jgi:hypothetical protein
MTGSGLPVDIDSELPAQILELKLRAAQARESQVELVLPASERCAVVVRGPARATA